MSRKMDGGLRSEFHGRLRKGFHWQAIESALTGSGIPDSNFCGDGVEGWIEFKATSAWAIEVQRKQPMWHSRRWRKGGRTFVATRRKHDGGKRKGKRVDELWICSGWQFPILKEEGLKSDNIEWEGIFHGGKSKWDWDRIREILTQDFGNRFENWTERIESWKNEKRQKVLQK